MKMNRNRLLLSRISLLCILLAIPVRIASRPVPAIPSTQILYNAASAHYYERIDTAGLTWEQARAAAESRVHRGLRGHLVTITSAEENAVVFLLGNLEEYHLGGYRDPSALDSLEPDSDWKWVTGEHWDFSAWSDEDSSEVVSRSGSYLIAWPGDSWKDGEGKTAPGYVVEYEAQRYRSVCCLPQPARPGPSVDTWYPIMP